MIRGTTALLCILAAAGCAVAPPPDDLVTVHAPRGTWEVAALEEGEGEEHAEEPAGEEHAGEHAEEHAGERAEEPPEELAIDPADEHGEEYEEGNHFVNLFLGYTWERGGNGPTIGLDYVYRLMPGKLGIGTFFDYVAGADTDITAFGVGAFFYPYDNFVIPVLPGLEWKHDERSVMLRLGVAYEIPYKGWFVSPTAYVDFVKGGERLFILGLGIGTTF